jgi:hypothetical protein
MPFMQRTFTTVRQHLIYWTIEQNRGISMSKPVVINKFRFHNRKFQITLNTSADTGEESLELYEEVTVKEKPA